MLRRSLPPRALLTHTPHRVKLTSPSLTLPVCVTNRDEDSAHTHAGRGRVPPREQCSRGAMAEAGNPEDWLTTLTTRVPVSGLRPARPRPPPPGPPAPATPYVMPT